MIMGKFCPTCHRSISDPGRIDMSKYASYWRDNKCYICGTTLHVITVTPEPAPEAPTPAERSARCPYCGSSQVSANKRGFSIGSGLLGTFLTGNFLGMLFGTCGSDKVEATCINCGRTWAL